MEAAIRKCASTCSDPNDCVVFTGHSQGGAVAAVAAVHLSDLNPYAITFGQPPTIMAPCPKVSSERWYRFLNTKVATTNNGGQDIPAELGDISYDPAPFAPGCGAQSFGHMIILSADTSGVAYMGLDSQTVFSPYDIGFQSHFMEADKRSPFPGYLDRIQRIMQAKNVTYPIRTNGFITGSSCTQKQECESGQCGRESTIMFSRCLGTQCKYSIDCETGHCDSGLCLPKLGSCHPCNKNSDCIHGTCLKDFSRCSGPNSLMDNECSCKGSSQCVSQRCAANICEAKLPVGTRCVNHFDCLSGLCMFENRLGHGKKLCVTPGPAPTSLVSMSIVESQVPKEQNEQSTYHHQHYMLRSISFFIVVLTVGAIAYYGFLQNRHHGYERIPTGLNA